MLYLNYGSILTLVEINISIPFAPREQRASEIHVENNHVLPVGVSDGVSRAGVHPGTWPYCVWLCDRPHVSSHLSGYHNPLTVLSNPNQVRWGAEASWFSPTLHKGSLLPQCPLLIVAHLNAVCRESLSSNARFQGALVGRTFSHCRTISYNPFWCCARAPFLLIGPLGGQVCHKPWGALLPNDHITSSLWTWRQIPWIQRTAWLRPSAGNFTYCVGNILASYYLYTTPVSLAVKA